MKKISFILFAIIIITLHVSLAFSLPEKKYEEFKNNPIFKAEDDKLNNILEKQISIVDKKTKKIFNKIKENGQKMEEKKILFI